MTVHCIHIFDRRGKTLFTKTYSSTAAQQQLRLGASESNAGVGVGAGAASSPVEEQRKLVFGMLFSLGELMGKLTDKTSGISSVQTGASTVHNYETVSGLRFALYTSTNVPNSRTSLSHTSTSGSNRILVCADDALIYIYTNLWLEYVVRSPMYKPGRVLAVGEQQVPEGDKKFDITTTNFERKLDDYITSLSWFR